MHVLYFPLICEDTVSERPDPRWARQIIRESSAGWRCAVLFRPEQPIDEVELWERTRSVLDKIEACVREAAETAFLFAQRLVKALQAAGLDGTVPYRFAVLVCDGRKLHFFMRGFRTLLWGVPIDGTPPLRMTVEDKHNVIESRDFPTVQARDPEVSRSIPGDPVVAVVDRVEPEGLLNTFTRCLENFLVMTGPLSARRLLEDRVPQESRALWHLWEEINNLASVDLRRFEARLQQTFPNGMVGTVHETRNSRQQWVKRFGLPAALAFNGLLMLIVIFMLAGQPDPAPVMAGRTDGAANGITAPGGTGAAGIAGAAAKTTGDATSAPADAIGETTGPGNSATNRIAAFVRDASPTDRIAFTRPVKLFVERRVTALLGGEPISTRTHRTLLDVTVQILANRACDFQSHPVPVDGEVGDTTLSRLFQCGQKVNGLKELVIAYRQPTADPLEIIERIEPMVDQMIQSMSKP